MTAEVQTAMRNSCKDFIEIVWPQLSPKIGGGVIIPAESIEEEFASLLDTISGIDAFQVLDNKSGIRGIASRVQWNNTPWNTFTIRAKTRFGYNCELSKKYHLIKSGEFIYPFYTVQAYINKLHGNLLSAAAIKTFDLYKSIDEQPQLWRTRENPQDGNLFIWASWKELECKGYGIIYA